MTNTPKDWLQGMARLRWSIAREVGAWEWAFVRERGPDTGMLHIHAVVRGPWLDKWTLSVLASRAGFGEIVHIGVAKKAGRYAAKAAEYAGKAAGGYQETLTLNRGRPWHQSRGYTKGVPMREFVPRHAPARDPGPWVMIPGHEVPGHLERVAAWDAAGEAAAAALDFDALEAADRVARADVEAVRRVKDELGGWDLDDVRSRPRW